MRASVAEVEGVVEHLGVRIHYEVYGDGPLTVLLLPTWTIVHKRLWKAQVSYLARHLRVVCYDGPGNGRSDRPETPEPYTQAAQVAYALAVLDATGTERAVVVGLSRAANWALELAADHPSRVLGTIVIGPAIGLGSAEARTLDAPVSELEPSVVPAGRIRRPTGEVQRAVLAGALRRLPVVLHWTVLQRNPFDEADRGRCRLGP
jgi:pimeloyl-ACP methyl ester carboxylesterase